MIPEKNQDEDQNSNNTESRIKKDEKIMEKIENESKYLKMF